MMRKYSSSLALVAVGLILVLYIVASRTMLVLQSKRGSSLSLSIMQQHRAMQASPTAPSITPSTTNHPTVYLNRVRTHSPMKSSGTTKSPIIMTSSIDDQTTIATEEQTNTPTIIQSSYSPKCQGSNPLSCGCNSVRQTE